MATDYSAALRAKVLKRLRAGETVAAVSADTGISRSTLHRWKREGPARAVEAGAVEARAVVAAAPDTTEGLLADITGPGITDRWGMPSTDLGISILAPNGKLVSVFGDTFSGNRVGEGDWRSPVVLIGTGDADHRIQYERAGGDDPNYARQLWFYIHDDASTGWTRGGISTVIPSDLLRVGARMYLHAIVNRGLGTVIWTEIWSSDDSGISWQHMGEKAKFPGPLHNGYAQCWSWDYEPDDGWVYVVSTGFQRDRGIILRRVRPEGIGDMWKYSGWGYANGRWAWDNEPTPITPGGETWGELCLRRLQAGKWVLGGFLSSKYALGYRTIDSPIANMYDAPIQMPVIGTTWDNEDRANSKVAQLYGGYVLPGSQLDVIGGAGLVVSQWNVATGWPYRAMQFKSTINDTTTEPASIPMTWEPQPASIPMTPDALDALRRATGVEKVLSYDHRIVPQETGYWCGPAATQVVLNSRGIFVEERVLAHEIGTTHAGTDFVELIERVLDRRVPQARYTSVHMPNDPPSSAQRERLWRDLVRSIDAGWGVIMNWVAPPWNYPRGVKGSISPAYHGGTVYHYVAAMGYDDTPGARAVWIADSGFAPFGYWCGFDQVATLVPPKAYTYADAAP